jgi:hypothetical protein
MNRLLGLGCGLLELLTFREAQGEEGVRERVTGVCGQGLAQLVFRELMPGLLIQKQRSLEVLVHHFRYCRISS